MGYQRVAIEHVHVVFFAQAQHFLGRGVIVEAGIGVDGQGQHIDVGLAEELVQRVLLGIGREAAPRLDQHFFAPAEVVGDEQLLTGVGNELRHFGKVEGIDILVAENDFPLFLQQAHDPVLSSISACSISRPVLRSIWWQTRSKP